MANLLTNETKKVNKSEARNRRFGLVLVFIIILLVVAIVLNISLWASFRIQKQIKIFPLSVADKDLSLTTTDEVRAKEQVDQLAHWWPEHNWSSVISRVENIRPRSIKINQISGFLADKNNLITLALAGQTDSRQSLVDFVDALRQDKLFSQVDLPIEYLLSTSKGQFVINLQINNK